MNRLERRQHVLAGRRRGAFDPAQRLVEAAPRARAARLVRGALASGRNVIVRHARWAGMRWFLEDVAADVSAWTGPRPAAVVDLGAVGRGDDARVHLVDVIARALDVHGVQRAMVATSRDAFRARAGMVLRKARDRRRRVLLCERADHLGYAILQDLCDAIHEATAEMTPGTAPLVVFACRIGGHSLDLPDAVSFFLPDPTVDEAVGMLAELLGETDVDHLRSIVDRVGPVPDFLEGVARAFDPGDADAVREALAPQLRELDQARGIVSATDALADRIDVLAFGAQPFDKEVDWPLLRSGLVAVRDRTGGKMTALRTPLMAFE